MPSSNRPAIALQVAVVAVAVALVVPAVAPAPAHAEAGAVAGDVRTAHEAWESTVAPVKSAARELEAAETALASAREAVAAAEAVHDQAAERSDAARSGLLQADAALVRALARARMSGVQQQSSLRAVEDARAASRSRSGDFVAAGNASNAGGREESRIRNDHARAQLEVALAWHDEAVDEYEQHRAELDAATVARDAASAERVAAEQAYPETADALAEVSDAAEAAADAVAAKRDVLADRQSQHDRALADFRGLGWRAGVLGRGGLVWPTDGDPGSRFGSRRHPITKRVRLHAGVDVPAPTGQPVVSTADGTVTFAGRSGGYGFMVDVDHGGGRMSRYAHLSYISVSKGDRVAQGEQVGKIGSTGASTGPHLHFEYRIDGEPQDPMRWFGGVIDG